jgi:transcriptional regulator with XRE-family HTH domain
MKFSLRQRFGAQVKSLRIAAGISQEAFADRCGIARSYMSRIERGLANPSLDAIEALAAALAVEVRDLFEKAAPVPSWEVLEVPYAADGTVFHPGLGSPRDGSFRVGDRGHEIRFKSFDEALAYLRAMPVAKWRRPNVSGNWGLVAAEGWVKTRR